MSQHTAQQVTRIRKEKSVTTKEFPIPIKIAKDSKNFCRDRVNRLKRKMFVSIRKIMSRQTPRAEEHEKQGAYRFGVVTQYIPVATRPRLLHQNFVVTLSKSVETESKKELRE